MALARIFLYDDIDDRMRPNDCDDDETTNVFLIAKIDTCMKFNFFVYVFAQLFVIYSCLLTFV